MAKRPKKLDVSYTNATHISPIGSRYNTPMSEIFGEEAYLQAILDVEAENVSALSEMYPEKVPKEAAKKIKSIANTKSVKPENIRKTEAEITHHEMGAVVMEMAKAAGNEGRYVHFGMTSADAVETAKAKMLADALKAMIKTASELRNECLRTAVKWKDTPAIMRTHGQHAIPASFGLPFAFFGYSLQKNIERLEYDLKNCTEGKLSGAIGTYDVHTVEGIDGKKVERRVLEKLGVKVPDITMQIPARENIVYVIADLSTLCGRIEAISEYIKALKRTEILELKEEPDENTIGSSAMPHKNLYGNPFIEERCVSIARVVRGHALAALESVMMEDFRDLSASLSDRIAIPESFILSDYSCRLMQNIIQRLEPMPENIKSNLDKTKGTIASQLIMSRLIKKGISREEARRVSLRSATAALDNDTDYIAELLKDREIAKFLSKSEIKELSNPEASMGLSKEIIESVAKKYLK